MKKLSLCPYNGNLYLANSRREYAKLHKRIFKSEEILSASQAGRFSGGCGKDGMWTYLVWASSTATLAHELAHVVFHVFERCGIDARHDDGEAFCYMLSQLILDARQPKKRKKRA